MKLCFAVLSADSVEYHITAADIHTILNISAELRSFSVELCLQKFKKNSAESWKYICRDMGKSSLNFCDNSAECLEIMMQKNANVL